MSAKSDYDSRCKWGQFDISGPLRALNNWISASQNDARWLDTLAEAFEAAGGTGVVSTLPDVTLSAALASAGVSATRADLAIEPATISGIQPSTGFAADPVNVATSNFVLPETDLSFARPSHLLSCTRTYNSVDMARGVFGLGWSSRLDEHLEIDDERTAWIQADGGVIEFMRDGATYARHACRLLAHAGSSIVPRHDRYGTDRFLNV